LADNLRLATSDFAGARVLTAAGRLAVELPDDTPWDELRGRLSRVFGVANFSRVRETVPDMEALRAAVVPAMAGEEGTFRVTATRAWKGFPLASTEIERQLGGAIVAGTGRRVRLTEPELTVFVEVHKDRILFSLGKEKGAGGFPPGSSGRVLALLSGGIDSPVAAWRLMKRGCRVDFVNFHAFPLQDRTMIDKVRALAASLTRWQYASRLFSVPFARAQQTIVAEAPAPLRVVLYRRFMVRIAEALAARHGAKALVTGESLGQVASQTLDNMAVIDAAARGPVLRPLVGMDKDEITQQARRIGTYEVSILPDQDCCQLFVPRAPSTAARLEEVQRAEAALDVEGLTGEAVRAAEEERFRFPEAPGL
jgi:thiamine biosynthesis protein ThiI